MNAGGEVGSPTDPDRLSPGLEQPRCGGPGNPCHQEENDVNEDPAKMTGWETDIRSSEIPEYMMGPLIGWVLRGGPTGSFLTAVLENDFSGALGHADQANLASLRPWHICLHNFIPGNCHGSPEIVAAWREHKGLEGQQP